MSNDLCIAVGDAGSANFLIPTFAELSRQGITYRVFADPEGAGVSSFTAAGIPFVASQEADLEGADLVICGTCAKAKKLQIAATLAAQKKGVPVLWAGDTYLCGCEHDMMRLQPDFLTTLDVPAQEMALRARPAMTPEQLPVIGNPSFDHIAGVIRDQAKIRTEVRARLHLADSQKLVVLAASSFAQFSAEEMVATLTEVNTAAEKHEFAIIPRFHPADKKKDPDAVARFKSIVASHAVEEPAGIDALHLYAASDATVVHWSTDGVKASLVTHVLFTLLPSIRRYLRGLAGSWPFFPQIEYRLAEAAWSQDEIAPALCGLLDPEPDYRDFIQRQRARYFAALADGRATERFVGLVRSLL